MSDAVVKIATIVDTDAVKTGTAENVQTILTGNQKIGVSFVEVQSISTAAFRKISSESKTMAQSISVDSLKTAEATKELKLAQDDLANAMKLRNSEMLSSIQVDALIAAAQDRVKAATEALAGSQRKLAVAQEAVAVGSAHAVSGVQATSAAIRTLEGNAGIRAVENFLAKTLGLGPALQAIFPVVGLLAFGKILFDIGNEVYESAVKTNAAAETIKKDYAEINDELRITNAELAVGNDKLEDQIAKLGHHPADGLRTGLDEDSLAALRLGKELDKDIDKVKALSEKNAVGFWAGLANNKGETKDTSNLIAYVKKEVDDKRKEADALVEQARATGNQANVKDAQDRAMVSIQNAYAVADAKIKNAQSAAKKAQDFHESAAGSTWEAINTKGSGVEYSSSVDNKDNLNLLSGGRELLLQEQVEIGESYRKGVDEQKDAIANAGKGLGEAANKAAQEQLRAMEEARLKQEQEGRLGAQADQEYWEARIGKFKAGSTEYLTIQQKLERDRKDLSSHAEAYGAEQARGAEIAAKNTEGLALANIQLEVASGKITKLSGDQQAASVHAAEYTAKLSALRKELEAINADKQLSPEEKKNKGAAVQNQIDDTSGQQATAAVQDKVRAAEADKEASDKAAASAARLAAEVAKSTEIQAENAASLELATIAANEQSGSITKLSADHQTAAVRSKEFADKIAALRVEMSKLKEEGSGLQSGSDAANVNAADQQRVQNQIDQLSGQQKTASVVNNAKIGQDLAKPYIDAFGKINSGWLKVQNDLIAGNRNIKRDFAQMGLSLVETAAKWAEGILAHEVQYIIQSRAAHIAGNQAKVASDAATGAESTGIVQAEGLKQALIDAKSSAVKGWKAGMALPFPENVVAAPALAAVGFAGAISQFNEGGMVTDGGGMHIPILAKAGERVLSTTQTNNFERMVNGSGNSGNVHINMGGNNFSQAGSDFKSQWSAHERHIVKRLKTLRREGKL